MSPGRPVRNAPARPERRAGAAPPADVCIVLEPGYPYAGGALAGWTADLVNALAPRRVAIACVHAFGDLPRAFSREVPAHVRELWDLVPADDRWSDGARGSAPSFGAGLWRIQRAFRAALAPGERRALVARARPLVAALAALAADADASLDKDALRFATAPEPLWDALEAVAQHARTFGGARMASERLLLAEVVQSYRAYAPRSGFRPFALALTAMTSRLARVLELSPPEARLYHAIGAGAAGLVAARAAMRFGAPLVVTDDGREDPLDGLDASAHGEPDRGGATDRVARAGWTLTERLVLARADRGLASSAPALQRLYARGLGAERGAVIPWGADLARYGGLRARAAPPARGRPFRVAFYGRFAPTDDLATFVLVARAAIERIDMVEVVAVGAAGGDPGYLGACQLRAQILGLERVLRFTSEIGLFELLPTVDALVLPGVAAGEPPGLAAAMAAGVPVVCADEGAARVLVAGEIARDAGVPRRHDGARATQGAGPDDAEAWSAGDLPAAGLLAPPGDAMAMAAALVRLAANPALWTRCARAGEARAARLLRRDRGLERYAALYDDLGAPSR